MCFRVIRKPVATKVHINLSAALLMGNLVFLIGVDQVREREWRYNKTLNCLVNGAAGDLEMRLLHVQIPQAAGTADHNTIVVDAALKDIVTQQL